MAPGRKLSFKESMAEPDDLVTVYMSSHGTPPEKFGGVFIVTYDSEVKPRERIWHTSITETMLKDFIEGLRARRLVMILDACYSNGAYRKVPGFLPPGGKSLGASDAEGYGISKEYGKRLLGAKDIVLEEAPSKPKAKPKSAVDSRSESCGKVLIGASGPGEQSWESDSLNNSIFTYYFLHGLNRNNGSVQNAFYYAKPLVPQRVKQEKGADVGWKKWTPKSDKINERRRCQNERDSAGTLHEGVSWGGSEDGVSRGYIVAGGSSPAVIAALDVRELGQGA